MVDPSRTTRSEDTLLFYFTLISGSVANTLPSPLPEHGVFLSVFLPGRRRNNDDAGKEEITGTICGVKCYCSHSLAVLRASFIPELKLAGKCGFVTERLRQSPYCSNVSVPTPG